MAGTYDERYNKSESATRFIKRRVSEVAPTLDSDDDSSSERKIKLKPALLTSIIAGGFAGVVVDIGLFPLDTIKTRLQSEAGFRASGGFRGIYKGIIPVLLSSAPLSALFFATYNTAVNSIKSKDASLNPFVYFAAATAAEVLCASLRVPLEVLKQRQQATQKSAKVLIKKTYEKEGLLGFYRGLGSTLLREIPFAAIQYPLWEIMINRLIIYENGEELTAFQTALCGAAAGGIAGAVTTPMDVVRTRVMLAEREKIEQYKSNVNWNIAREVYKDRGIHGFCAGMTPRVLWIMLGGFLYFGAYETVKILCEKNWCDGKKKDQHVSEVYMEVIEKVPNFAEKMCKIQNKIVRMMENSSFNENDIDQNDVPILKSEEAQTSATPLGFRRVLSSADAEDFPRNDSI